MAHDPAAFADMVTLTVKAALAPLLERVASLDARVAQAQALEPAVATLRDRIVVIETKAAAPVVTPEPHDLSPVLERVAVTEARVARHDEWEQSIGDLHDKLLTLDTKSAVPADVYLRPTKAEVELSMRDTVEPLKATLAAVQERVAVLEVRPLLPGPAGKDGAPGLNGKDGAPGKDGLAGLSYEGVYQEGKAYEPGQLATWGGSAWHCNEPTTSKPGEGSQAWTLMIKRGRDGKDGKDAEVVPVVSLSGGRR